MPCPSGHQGIQDDAAISVDRLMDFVLELSRCASLLSQRGIGIGAAGVRLVRDFTAGRGSTLVSAAEPLPPPELLRIVVNQGIQGGIGRNQRGVSHHPTFVVDQAFLPAECDDLAKHGCEDSSPRRSRIRVSDEWSGTSSASDRRQNQR